MLYPFLLLTLFLFIFTEKLTSQPPESETSSQVLSCQDGIPIKSRSGCRHARRVTRRDVCSKKRLGNGKERQDCIAQLDK